MDRRKAVMTSYLLSLVALKNLNKDITSLLLSTVKSVSFSYTNHILGMKLMSGYLYSTVKMRCSWIFVSTTHHMKRRCIFQFARFKGIQQDWNTSGCEWSAYKWVVPDSGRYLSQSYRTVPRISQSYVSLRIMICWRSWVLNDSTQRIAETSWAHWGKVLSPWTRSILARFRSLKPRGGRLKM